MDELMMTSESWARLLGARVLDPDGWDRAHYSFSWYKEKIDQKEFDRRFAASTVDTRGYLPVGYFA